MLLHFMLKLKNNNNNNNNNNNGYNRDKLMPEVFFTVWPRKTAMFSFRVYVYCLRLIT